MSPTFLQGKQLVVKRTNGAACRGVRVVGGEIINGKLVRAKILQTPEALGNEGLTSLPFAAGTCLAVKEDFQNVVPRFYAIAAQIDVKGEGVYGCAHCGFTAQVTLADGSEEKQQKIDHLFNGQFMKHHRVWRRCPMDKKLIAAIRDAPKADPTKPVGWNSKYSEIFYDRGHSAS